MTVQNLLQVHSHVYISLPPGLVIWGFTEVIRWGNLLVTRGRVRPLSSHSSLLKASHVFTISRGIGSTGWPSSACFSDYNDFTHVENSCKIAQVNVLHSRLLSGNETFVSGPRGKWGFSSCCTMSWMSISFSHRHG